MSGIVIDVEGGGQQAKQDLAAINRQLAQLVITSQKTNKLISGLNFNNLKQANTQLAETTSHFKKVEASGSSAFTTILKPLKATVNALTSVPALLTLVAAGFTAIAAVKTFYKVSDELTLMQNKLRLVVAGADELVSVQHELYRISRLTNVANDAAVSTYFNLARSMKSTGNSAVDLQKTTKTLLQTGAIGGSGTQAMTAGMLQFNQALASGVFRGDEFNSIMENLPRLAQAMTDGLGVTQGKLRAMAEEGKLTAASVLGALQSQAGKIDAEFRSVVITAEMGVASFTAAINNFVQSITNISKSNVHVGKGLRAIADQIDSYASMLLPTFYSVTQGLRNYFKEIDAFDASTLVLRNMSKFKISPFDALDAYDQYKLIKRFIDEYREKLGLAKKEANGLFETKWADKFKSKFSGFQLFDKEEPKFNLKEMLTDSIALMVALGHAASGVTSKFAWLIPDIRLPLATIDTVFTSWLKENKAWGLAMSIEIFMPLARGIEAVSEMMSLRTTSDRALERAWVDVFNSGDIKELTTNLIDLGNVGEDVRFQNWTIVFSDIASTVRSFKESSFAVLRYLNIIDNRVLYFNNIRFDRAIEGFKTFGSIVKRVYDDVIFPKILPPLTRVYAFARNMGLALYDAITDNFTLATGEEIGRKIVSGFISSVQGLTNVIADLFEDKPLSIGINKNSFAEVLKVFAERFVETIMRLVQVVAGVFLGMFKEVANRLFGIFQSPFERLVKQFKSAIADAFTPRLLVDRIADSLRSFAGSQELSYKLTLDPSALQTAMLLIAKMLEYIVNITQATLARVEKRIRQFGNYVNGVFFDIYDKVVGHSYWPDMVEGVYAWTLKLFDSQSLIGQFKDKVVSAFKSISEFVKNYSVKDAVINLGLRLESIDFGTLGFNLRQTLSASILASLLYYFGGPLGRFVALDYFFSSMDDALLAVFKKIPEFIGQVVGDGAGVMAATIVSGFSKMFDTLITALPKFTQSFISAFGPVGQAIAGILNFGPSSGLLYALIFGAGAYAIKAEKGMQTLQELWSGSKRKKGDPNSKSKEGIKDYINAIKGESKIPILYKAILGDNPQLLLAGIAMISTAALSSINLIESSLVGVPMLMFAILGKDAGGRAIRDAITYLPGLFSDFFKAMNFTMAKELNNKSVLQLAIERFAASIGDTFRAVQSNKNAYAAGTISFSDMFRLKQDDNFVGPQKRGVVDQFKQIFEEVGKIEIGSNTVGGLLSKFKEKFKMGLDTVIDELSDFWKNRNKIITSATNFVTPVKEAFTSVFSTVKTAFASMFVFIKQGFEGLLVTLRAIPKVAIFATLVASMAFFATSAQAANGALAQTGGNLVNIAIGAAAATAALYAFARAGIAVTAFQRARKTFARTAVDNARDALDLVESTAFKADYVKNSGKPDNLKNAKAAGKRARAERAAEIGADAFSSFDSIKAGFSAFSDSVKETVNQVKAFVIKAFTFIWTTTSALIASIISKTMALMAFLRTNLTIANLQLAWTTAAGIVAGSVALVTAAVYGLGRALVWVVSGAFVKSIAAFVMAARAAGFMAALLARVPAAFHGILLAVKGAVAAIGSMTALLFSGGALAVGAIGLWLFGPGDSLFDTLEILKDKLTSLFGMTPTSEIGRQSTLKALLPDREIGNMEIRFSAILENVDLSKLKANEFKAIEASAVETKELLDRLTESYAQFGKLTTEQIREYDAALAKQKEILNSQPKKENRGLDGTLATSQGLIEFVDNSLFAKLNRLFKMMVTGFMLPLTGLIALFTGGTIRDATEITSSLFLGLHDMMAGLKKDVNAAATEGVAKLDTFWNAFTDMLDDVVLAVSSPLDYYNLGAKETRRRRELPEPEVEGLAKLRNPLNAILATGDFAQELGMQIGDEVRKLITAQMSPEAQDASSLVYSRNRRIKEFATLLPEDTLKRYSAAELDFANKFKLFNDLNTKETTFTPAGPDAKRLAQLRAEADAAEKIYTEMYVRVEAAGTRAFNVQKYMASVKALGEAAKTSFDWDLGSFNKNFFGNDSDEEALLALTLGYESFFKELKSGTATAKEALKIKETMKSIEIQAKALQDALVSKSSFKTYLEFQLQVTGIESSADALAEFFANNQQEYFEWEQAYKKALAAKTAFSKLQLGTADAETVKRLLKEIKDANEEVEAKKPKTDLFTQNRVLAQKIGAQPLAGMDWLGVTKKGLESINSALEKADKAKRHFERPGQRPFEESLRDLRDMLDTLRNVKEQMAKQKLRALGALTDTATPWRERKEGLELITGDKMPVPVAANSARSEAWMRATTEKATLINERDAAGLVDDKASENKFNKKLAELDERLARIADIPAKLTTSAFFSALSDIKAPFDASEFLRLPEDIASELRTSALAVMQDKEAAGKGLLNRDALTAAAKRQRDAEALGQRQYARFAFKTPEEDMQRFRDAGLEFVNAVQFNNLQSNPDIRKLVDSFGAARSAQDLKSESPAVRLAAIKKLEEVSTSLKEANLNNLGFEGISAKLKEALPNIEIEPASFAAFRDSLNSFLLDFERNKTTAAGLGTSQKDLTIARDLALSNKRGADNIETMLASQTFTGRGNLSLRRATGQDLGPEYALISNSADKLIRGMADSITAKMNEVSQLQASGELTPDIERAAKAFIDGTKISLDAAISREVVTRKDTQAFQAGQSMAQDIQNNMFEGVKSVLKGQSSVGDFLKNMLSAATSKILDTFVSGAASALMKKDGLLGRVLGTGGENLFNLGAGLFGGNGEKDYKVTAEQELTTALQELKTVIERMTGFSLGNTPPTNGSAFGGFGDVSTTGYDTPSLLASDTLDFQWPDLQKESTRVLSGIGTETNSVLGDLTQISSKGFADVSRGLLGLVGGGSSGLGTLNSFLQLGSTILGIGQKLPGLPKMDVGGAINAAWGAPVPIMAHGGEVLLNPAQQQALIMNGMPDRKRSDQQVFNINVTGDISRQTRSEIQKMIPQIATGVNMHNYEQGNSRR